MNGAIVNLEGQHAMALNEVGGQRAEGFGRDLEAGEALRPAIAARPSKDTFRPLKQRVQVIH